MWVLTVGQGPFTSVNTNAGWPTEQHELVLPPEADVLDALAYVSRAYATKTFVCLTRTQPDGIETYRYRREADGLLYAISDQASFAYVYRDGSDEFSWFMDARGVRQCSGWTPFPYPTGMSAHHQIKIESEEHGVAYTADEGIAHILQFLLNLGIYTEHSCECYRLSSHPFRGLFAYINVATFQKGAPTRPNTSRLRSITATELASVLGLSAHGEDVLRWHVNEANNVLLFDPAAVVLGNQAG